MRFLKHQVVAMVITALVVAGCLVYGFTKKPADLIPVRENTWVADSANVLSGRTENVVTGYNKAWDSNVRSVTAVAAVKSTKGWDIKDYAQSLGEKWGLGYNDMLLLLDIGGDEYTIVYTASKIVADSDVNAALVSGFASAYAAGDYDAAVQGFFTALDAYYTAAGEDGGDYMSYGGDAYGYYNSGYGSGFSAVVLIIIPLLILALFISAVDRARYRTWYGRYKGVKGAPVFIPILFWHRPGGAWFRHMGSSMHMPPPGHRRGPGPGGFGGGFGGGRGGGFGGGFGGGRGGGFGGGRGGGFGGGFGGGRGGGFGGGRGGGFGGRR